MEAKISIIIPVYNTEKFLKQCIESIISQTYRNLEIICVNDGTKDNSLEILNEYAVKDNRIIVVNKDNGGLSSARNAGLEILTGDYVMFVDSDDWIDHEICAKAIEEAESSEADVVFWSYAREFLDNAKIQSVVEQEERYVYDATNVNLLHRRLFGLLGVELKTPEKADSLVTAWGKLYRRNIIENIRFVDTKIIGTEDALYNVYVFNNVKKAVYLPEYAYHYRKYNGNSLTASYNPMLYERWQNLYEFMGSFIKEKNLTQDFQDALLNRRALGLIGLSLNIIQADKNVIEKILEIKKIISEDKYKKAFDNLEFQYLAIHWKIFFGCAKYQNAIGLYLLAWVMQKLRGN